MKHSRFRKHVLLFILGFFAGIILYRKYGPKGCTLLQEDTPSVFSSTILLRILTQRKNSTETQAILRILDGCKVDVEVLECDSAPCRADYVSPGLYTSRVLRHYQWLVVAADFAYVATNFTILQHLLLSISSEQPIVLFREKCVNSGILVASADAVLHIASTESANDAHQDLICGNSANITYYDLDKLIKNNLKKAESGWMKLNHATKPEHTDTLNTLIFHQNRKMSSLQNKMELLMKEINILVMKYLSLNPANHGITISSTDRIHRNFKEWDFVNKSLVHSLHNVYSDPTEEVQYRGRQLPYSAARRVSALPVPQPLYQRIRTNFGVEHVTVARNPLSESTGNPQVYRILQPFDGQRVLIETRTYTKDLVIILPLYRRSGFFSKFLKRLQSLSLDFKGILILQVVLFEDKKHEHQLSLNAIEESKGKLFVQVLQTKGRFSRAEAISQGLELLHEGTRVVIMDVDMAFTADFLNRVIKNTKQSSQAYFPIYFSRYDPGTIWHTNTTLRTHPQNEIYGTWRHFSFGIVGIYKSDILAVGGFDRSLKGWGQEDVSFYEKCVSSHLKVFRSVDPGLWHLYHDRYCSRSLKEPQRFMCHQSKLQLHSSQRSLADFVYTIMNIQKGTKEDDRGH